MELIGGNRNKGSFIVKKSDIDRSVICLSVQNQDETQQVIKILFHPSLPVTENHDDK